MPDAIERFVVWHPDKGRGFVGDTENDAWVYMETGRKVWREKMKKADWACSRVTREPDGGE